MIPFHPFPVSRVEAKVHWGLINGGLFGRLHVSCHETSPDSQWFVLIRFWALKKVRVRKTQQLGTPATFPCTPHGPPGRNEPHSTRGSPREASQKWSSTSPPAWCFWSKSAWCRHGKVTWPGSPAIGIFGGTIWRKTWPHARLEPRRNGWKPTKTLKTAGKRIVVICFQDPIWTKKTQQICWSENICDKHWYTLSTIDISYIICYKSQQLKLWTNLPSLAPKTSAPYVLAAASCGVGLNLLAARDSWKSGPLKLKSWGETPNKPHVDAKNIGNMWEKHMEKCWEMIGPSLEDQAGYPPENQHESLQFWSKHLGSKHWICDIHIADLPQCPSA